MIVTSRSGELADRLHFEARTVRVGGKSDETISRHKFFADFKSNESSPVSVKEVLTEKEKKKKGK